MALSYNKLWHVLVDKKMSKTDLRRAAGLTTNALAKFGKDESVPLETLEKVCRVLDCTFDDVVEIVPDKEEPGRIVE
ncbi:MAG: helix-turn-helix transcriptional regulator [Butyrivibrio sp.]|nr:helix-turn-helix transcriptional regulator [Butyrivibrio sp.]MDO5439425.1 helix-turn-helix transcriptional regulator [Erysipelotrichaceae bacterium]